MRQAIADAAPGKTVRFDSTAFAPGGSPYTITVASELAIGNDLTIAAPADSVIIVSGGDSVRVFRVTAGGDVTISGVTIVNGNATGSFPDNVGGGIHKTGTGTLNLSNVTLSGNSAGAGGGALYLDDTAALNITGCTISGNSTPNAGGGIYHNGTGPVTILDSTLSGNSAQPGDGGGMVNDEATVDIINSTISGNSGRFAGGIYNAAGGTLNLTNATVSGNTATDHGAGLYNTGTATLTNTTVASNSAAVGGGIRNDGGSVSVRNTIIADNMVDSGGSGPDISSSNAVSASFSLIGDTFGATITETSPGTNITGQDPLLSALADNGGPTLTHAPEPGSPAVDKGKNLAVDENSNPIEADQRGSVREVRYRGTIARPVGGDFSDVGAVELAEPANCTEPPEDMVAWWPGGRRRQRHPGEQHPHRSR